MNDKLTDVTVVLDRSGSMGVVRTDTIGGFNTFLAEQRKGAGEANISLTQFDDVYDVTYTAKPAKDAPELTEATYVPRNNTALLDAIGRTIHATGDRLKNMNDADRPGTVIFVIVTDGQENASHEYDYTTVTKMIEHQRDKYQWQFVFLGANQNAITVASNLGMNNKQAMSYGANAVGTAAAFRSSAQNVNKVRHARGVMGQSMQASEDELSYTDEDKIAQAQAGVDPSLNVVPPTTKP